MESPRAAQRRLLPPADSVLTRASANVNDEVMLGSDDARATDALPTVIQGDAIAATPGIAGARARRVGDYVDADGHWVAKLHTPHFGERAVHTARPCAINACER